MIGLNWSLINFMDTEMNGGANTIDNGPRLSSDYHMEMVKKPIKTIEPSSRISDENYRLEPSILSR